MHLFFTTMPTTLFHIEVLLDYYEEIVIIHLIEVYMLVDNKCHGNI